MTVFVLSVVFGFIFLIIIEYLYTKKNYPKYYSVHDSIYNFFFGIIGFFVDIIVQILPLLVLSQIEFNALFDLSINDWHTWVIGYIIWDFIFYFMHRLEHQVWFFWAIHINHHSSEYLNLSTALRSGVYKSIYRYFFFVPIIFIGIPIKAMLLIYILGKIWAFFSHTQLIKNLGFLEYIFVTPKGHGLHHAYNKHYLGKNLGETFIIWDILFGTFVQEYKPPKFGIPEKLSKDIVKQINHEFYYMFKEANKEIGFYNKLKVIFGKPKFHY